MKRAVVAWAALGLMLPWAGAVEKTDLAEEVYIETSATDFKLDLTPVQENRKHVVGFRLSADAKGEFTVLCFIDGSLWAEKRMALPGTYRLNTRGMKPGEHRITLQAVDARGRVGSGTRAVRVPG